MNICFYNHASVILINILFYKIDILLRKMTSTNSIAYSPLMDCPSRSVPIQMIFRLTTYANEIEIHVSINNFSHDEVIILEQFFFEIQHNLNITLQVIFKKHFSIFFEYNLNNNINATHLKELDISVNNFYNEKNIQIFIPIIFLRLFSKRITSSTSAEYIENEVVPFFRNPSWMIPGIKYLFSALSSPELTKLLNLLQRKNLLTPYQLFLIIKAYPELSVIIKKTLSQNCINDVIQYSKNIRALKINKRDIAGGIYSIEESIFVLMREGIDLSYSTLLKHLQSIIQIALTIDLLLKKDFRTWVSEIESQDLLYATISITEDAVISSAISRDSALYTPLFRKYISERKIDGIMNLLNPSISYDEIMKARILFILNFRKLKMKRSQAHPERIVYLLSAFSNPNDYQYLLLSVGWYTLSTALKGLHNKIIASVLGHLPVTAQILIEDVLKGIVNPNILHDEMQINKARILCVNSILQLYSDGLINLE